MLCQWRVRKKGQEANPYEDYREFPSVFCLKINHGGTFTPPPMTRYKGGKVNWVDDIDSDTFSIVEVTSMLQELGYENPCMAYYYKKPNSELENGLVELVVDKDVYEMLMYVDKFKVIELYTDHTVKKQHVLTQEPLATIIDVTQPDSSSGNEAEVDVSEDEWLRESLKKLPIKSKKGQQSSRKEVGQSSRNGSGSENGSGSDSGSDSEDSDYFVDEENLIEDVDVDMAEFKRHTDPGVEWLGCKENVLEENEVFELEEVDHEEFDSGSDSDEGVRRKALRKVARMNKAIQGKGERVYKEDFFLGEQFATSKLVKDKVTRVSVEQRRQLSLKKNDKLRVRVVCKGQVPDFANNDMGSVIPFTGDQNGPISKVKPKSISKKEKVAKPRESYACPWAMQVSKLPNEDTWERKPLNQMTRLLLNTLKDQLQKKFEVGVSKQKVFRAKKMAYERSVETPEYSQTVKKKVQADSTYVLDPNNGIYPLAYAVVESESKDSWKWFLDCLGDDLELFRNSNFTFISDRQKALLDGRDKPIITCLEYIREYLMKRIVNVQKVQDKKWELSGIPCTHAVASIWDQANNGIDTGIPESYCLPVHWLTTWKEDLNKFKINPVNGPQGWKKSDVPTTIIPPKPHPQIGRPPKKRKKSAAELADEMMKSKKLTKTGKSVTCKSCKQVGHNSRGCKSKKGGGSQQAGVAGHGDAAHGSQQAGVHGSQTTQSTPQAS
ncbi:mutator type transposase [Tanacetum coccineum]